MSVGNKSFLKGFTLIEMLMVITVVMILVGITIPFLRGAEQAAMIKKAKTDISKLELAISMYESDFGRYPNINGGQNTNWLISWLTGFTVNGSVLMVKNYLGAMKEIYEAEHFWKGPYMKISSRDLDPAGNFIDPWGKRYSVDAINPANNAATVDIYSAGPDRIAGSVDDVSNYNRW
ncbi:MAG: type II secretion system protein GspG [bacterium]|nr:type II secretion system protein GspG [bacterium]